MILKKLAHYLFRWQYVLLTDHDGEITISRAVHQGKGWYASRFYGRNVRLLPNGKVSGPSFVKSWEPLTDGISVPWTRHA